jgi:tRNA(Ile)-lysidine synthetase-like protein
MIIIPGVTGEAKNPFVESVRASIEAHGLLPRRKAARQRREPVVIAVSGGPDSVALLHALVALAQKNYAIRPVVAHLHHGLREKAADEDRRFVRRLAAKLHCRCIAARVDVAKMAKRAGIGVEEAGRLARRQFLAEAARDCGATKVALGHTADDRAETVLFRILRGTGIEGLAPLAPRTVYPAAPPKKSRGGSGAHVEIIRPLIGATRSEVLAYLESVGQEYREDESNLESTYTRNRLRHELLPLLRERFNPKVDEALLRLADQAAAAGEILDDAVDAVWGQVVREMPASDDRARVPRPACPAVKKLARAHPRPGKPAVAQNEQEGARSLLIDADDFSLLRPWMQGAILRRAVERLGGGLKHMSSERTREVVSALLSKSVAGPVELPGGLVASRRRRAIRIGMK